MCRRTIAERRYDSELYIINAQADKMIVMSTTKILEGIHIDLVIWL